jgi:lambda family phage portal protein
MLDALRAKLASVLRTGADLAYDWIAPFPYRGGEINRLNRNWMPWPTSGDRALAANWELVTRRLRDQGRNDPVIIALKRALLDNIVGTGIHTPAAAMVDGEYDEEFCHESDEEFEAWAEEECDARGEQSWWDMQRQIFDECLEAGECLLLRTQDPDPDRQVPLAFQVLEAEQLDWLKNYPAQAEGGGSNEIRRGVEIDKDGKPVAYWLWERNPWDIWPPHNSHSFRVPAERVIHVRLPGRPSMTRGMGLYQSIMQTGRDLDNYLGSELTSAIIQSLFSIVHKTGKPGAGIGFGDGSGDEGMALGGRIKLGRGIVSQIGLEDEVIPLQSNRPNSQAEIFVRLMLGLVGMGGGVSRYRVTRDYTGTTYVAARAAQLDDRQSFRPMQMWLGRRLCRRVRREWTIAYAANRRFKSVSASQFLKQKRRWLRTEIQPPGWDPMDPSNEIPSNIAGMRAKIFTLKDVCALQGKNWRSQLRQAAREEKFARSLGLELDFQPAGQASPPAGKEDAEKKDQVTTDKE